MGRGAGAAQREILALGEAGYREVTLLGQNVDAYGRDLPGAAADGSGALPAAWLLRPAAVCDVHAACPPAPLRQLQRASAARAV